MQKNVHKFGYFSNIGKAMLYFSPSLLVKLSLLIIFALFFYQVFFPSFLLCLYFTWCSSNYCYTNIFFLKAELFWPLLYESCDISASDVKSAHTYTLLFRFEVYFGLIGEGRRNWEGMKWIWFIWLHWNHLNLVFLDKYFTFKSNILITPCKVIALKFLWCFFGIKFSFLLFFFACT